MPAQSRSGHIEVSSLRKQHAKAFRIVAHEGAKNLVSSRIGPDKFSVIKIRFQRPADAGSRHAAPYCCNVMRDLGMQFGVVTYDSWGSDESIQTLNAEGFTAEKFSVDADTEPYEQLKAALYESVR